MPLDKSDEMETERKSTNKREAYMSSLDGQTSNGTAVEGAGESNENEAGIIDGSTVSDNSLPVEDLETSRESDSSTQSTATTGDASFITCMHPYIHTNIQTYSFGLKRLDRKRRPMTQYTLWKPQSFC